MMGFVGGERSNNVGDSLDFEVSQQVALHLPPPPPSTPQALCLSVSPSFSAPLPTPISPPVCLFLSEVLLILLEQLA